MVEGDDLQDPIADAVRGILDGHIVLSRRLADRGLFPAVDVLKSISRVAPEIATREHMQLIQRARDSLSAYADAADLIQIGAYVGGSDPRVDAARVTQPKIEAFMRQSLDDGLPCTASLEGLRAIFRASA